MAARLLLPLCAIFLAACKTEPIYVVNHVPLSRPSGATESDVDYALRYAFKLRRWTGVKAHGAPGTWELTRKWNGGDSFCTVLVKDRQHLTLNRVLEIE